MLNLIGKRRHAEPSVALENYLEGTKYEIASNTFSLVWAGNLSAKQRQELKTLRTNSKVNH